MICYVVVFIIIYVSFQCLSFEFRKDIAQRFFFFVFFSFLCVYFLVCFWFRQYFSSFFFCFFYISFLYFGYVSRQWYWNIDLITILYHLVCVHSSFYKIRNCFRGWNEKKVNKRKTKEKNDQTQRDTIYFTLFYIPCYIILFFTCFSLYVQHTYNLDTCF